MQDNQLITMEKPVRAFTGEELAKRLELPTWRTLYKRLNQEGWSYAPEDVIAEDITEFAIKHYATTHAKRPVEITNAARDLAKELNIYIENYEHVDQYRGVAKIKRIAPKNDRKPLKEEAPIPPEPEKPAEAPLPPEPELATKADSPSLVLPILAAIVFIAADGFSCGFIGYRMYEDNRVAGAIFAIVGMAIGYIAIASIVRYKGYDEGGLRFGFGFWQLCIHVFAMNLFPASIEIGMVMIAIGLMLGTLGVSTTIKSTINH